MRAKHHRFVAVSRHVFRANLCIAYFVQCMPKSERWNVVRCVDRDDGVYDTRRSILGEEGLQCFQMLVQNVENNREQQRTTENNREQQRTMNSEQRTEKKAVEKY